MRCINQAVNFLLTRRGASQAQAKKVGLGMRVQFVEMIKNDLKCVTMGSREISARARFKILVWCALTLLAHVR